ncbi:hypothetical protein GCM10022244_57350 [Streptomyces gulbargensis]|uniref:Lipoprotein n=1 Tax=Streptomyces gulbargensis TaxID=364901 RepID=A0ABP7NDG5_9ACTN
MSLSPLRSRTVRAASLLLTTALASGALVGCALLEVVTADCEGTEARVKELAALGVLASPPAGATVPRGFEKPDAGCWADSGDVVLYAERAYAFAGPRTAVATHYRTAALRDGWTASPGSPAGDLCFTREDMALRIVFRTAGNLTGSGHGNRPDLVTGSGYSVAVETYANSGAGADCQVLSSDVTPTSGVRRG